MSEVDEGDAATASWIIDSTNRCRSPFGPRPRLRPAAPARESRPRALRRFRPRRPVSPAARQDSRSSARERPRFGRARPRARRRRGQRLAQRAAVRGERAAAARRRLAPHAATRPRGGGHRAAPRRRAAGAAARRRGAPAADHPARARSARPPRPRRRGRRRRRVPARRDGDPRRPAHLRPGRGPGARHRPRRRQPRRQRLQRPGAAAEGRALRGLLSHADLSLRAHRRRRQGQPHRVHRRPARGRQRRHLLELLGRRRPGSGLDPEGARAAHRQRDQRGHRPRRRAALLRRADPGLAGAQLSAQRGAQVGLPAAELRHRQPQRLPGGDPVLLEHRAEPRRDLHDAGKRAPRPGARQRVPLSRAFLLRLGQLQDHAERFGRRPLALFAAFRPRGRIALRRLRAAARPARLRRRLLEGLPRRGEDADAAPAADRPAR